MTKILIEQIRKLEDLLMFSKAYQKGMIKFVFRTPFCSYIFYAKHTSIILSGFQQ